MCTKKAFVSEVADELYDLFVLMHARRRFFKVEAELARRHHKRNNFKRNQQIEVVSKMTKI